MRADAAPLLAINPPAASVGQSFTISGAALGADAVHVWAFPNWPATDAVWVGAANSLASTPDPVRGLLTGGWIVQATNLPIGTYPLAVYAHDAATNTFPTMALQMVTVRPCVSRVECWPLFEGVMPSFVLIEACR